MGAPAGDIQDFLHKKNYPLNIVLLDYPAPAY